MGICFHIWLCDSGERSRAFIALLFSETCSEYIISHFFVLYKILGFCEILTRDKVNFHMRIQNMFEYKKMLLYDSEDEPKETFYEI